MDEWFKENIDYRTLILTVLLLLIGTVAVYSATYNAGASVVFYRQLLWMGIGIVLMVLVAFLPFRMLQLLSYPIYTASVVALLGVLIAGKTIAGSKSWFGLQGFGLQPSEIVKATTILAVASFMSRRQINLNRLKDVLSVAAFALLPVLLIIAQPDVGTALVYLGMIFLVMYWAGVSHFLVITVLAPIAAAVASLYGITPFIIVIALTLVILLLLRENRFISAIVFSLIVLVGVSVQFIFGTLPPHQQKRILIFMNPDTDPLGSGYNILQSKIAIGSGGLLGKGYLQGSQTQLHFIPAQWTDFIFCVPGEEFGFIGAAIILALFMMLLLRGARIASLVKSPYASIVSIGVISTFAVHIVINIGMSMGVVPVIGVPLPFISYGGSNLLTNMIMIGLLLNMYANRKEY